MIYQFLRDLLLTCNIYKKNIDESSFFFCVKKFTNNNLVSISFLQQNVQTHHLININTLTPTFNGVSIYRYIFYEFRVLVEPNKLPIQRANFKESALLSTLGLDFEEEYLLYVKKNFFNEDIRHRKHESIKVNSV